MDKRLLEFRKLRAEKLGRHAEGLTENYDDGNKLEQKSTGEPFDNEKDEDKFQATLLQQRNASRWETGLTFWDKYYVESILKFILWTCLFGFFIQIGFGAVYFIVSLSYVMYRSMTAGKNRIGPSAYSVFNDGCERIDGTFTAEQFENQLRRRTVPQ